MLKDAGKIARVTQPGLSLTEILKGAYNNLVFFSFDAICDCESFSNSVTWKDEISVSFQSLLFVCLV